MSRRGRLSWGMVIALVMLVSPNLYAEYIDELKDQVESLNKKFPQGSWDETYFRDMAIITHKADAAELTDYASELIRSTLFENRDAYVKSEWNEI